MSFDIKGNVSLTNPGSVTPEAPTSYIAAVNMGAPGAIGGTTPAAGNFTTLDASSTLVVDGASTLTGAVSCGGTVAIADTTTVATDKKILFRDSGLFIHSSADGKLLVSSDGSGIDDITLSGTITLDDDLITPTSKKVQFRDSALFINSSVDGQLDVDADTELEITAPTVDIDASVLVDISNALTVGGLLTATLGQTFTSAAATATADGTTTGTIAAGQTFVTAANGGSADNIIKLPAPTVGHIVIIFTTGALEVRSSTPASIAINGGTGASAESALPSGCVAVFICVSTTAWLAFQIASNGTTAGVEAAA